MEECGLMTRKKKTTFQIYQILFRFFLMYYHVKSYYLIFITLTTLYRIRLLIITYVEKVHIAKIKTHYLKLIERQMCVHACQTWAEFLFWLFQQPLFNGPVC